MKILIDMLGYLTESRNRGIGRYTKELALSLKKISSESIDIHLLLNTHFESASKECAREFLQIFGKRNIHYWRQPMLSDPHDFSSDEFQVAREIYAATINSLEPNAMVFTEPFTQSIGVDLLSRLNVKKFPIVYDLIPAIYPEDYLTNPAQKLWYEDRMREIGQMDTILTISESSKIEIERLIPNCCATISIGCDTSSSLEGLNVDFDIISGVDMSDLEFFLYTGGFDYRKSVDLLIKAFAQVIDQLASDTKLVLAGKIPDVQLAELSMLAKKLGCIDRVYFLGYVSDEELSWLYKNCLLFVNPSKHEGFGLTILEAMRCKAPVLAADNTNTIELLEIDEAKFRTHDLDHLVQQMSAIVTDKVVRDKILVYCEEKQKQYSWDLIAQAALRAIENECDANFIKGRKVNQPKNLSKLIERITQKSLSAESLIDAAKSINASIAHNVKEPQLLVDISILVRTDAKSGVQRVVRSILSEFLINNSSYHVRPIYFCFEACAFKYAEIIKSDMFFQFSVANNSECIDLYPSDVFLGLDLNHNLIVNYKDAFNKLVRSPASVYFVVYDLLPIQFPDFFDEAHGLTELHKDWVKGISKSDGIFCISKVVSDDFDKYLKSVDIETDTGFINTWFNLGADIGNSIPTKGLPDGFMIQCESFEKSLTVLMVGTLEPRKGHETILDAFEVLWKDVDVNLVLVGGRGWKSERLLNRISCHEKLNQNLFWFEGLSDEGLEKLYECSSGLIAASFGEGFGLPIIEAAHHGVPVLARDIPVFREVGGDSVAFFLDDSKDQLCSQIKAWLEVLQQGKALILNGFSAVSWEDSANHLLARIDGRKS